MKVIVAGCRNFFDYSFLSKKLDNILCKVEDLEIVCGGAQGVDSLGKQWAESKGYKVKMFPANWNGLGRSAGPIRNRQMAEYATHCICFWDYKSKGTMDMIERAKLLKLPLRIISIVP